MTKKPNTKHLSDPAKIKVRERLVRMMTEREPHITPQEWDAIFKLSASLLTEVDKIVDYRVDAARHGFACTAVVTALLVARAKRMEFGLAEAGVTFPMAVEALVEVMNGQALVAVKEIDDLKKRGTT